jgi:hypothetical protein
MKTISDSLSAKLSSAAENEVHVIINTKENTPVKLLNVKELTTLMPDVYTARLSKKTIMKLSKNKHVISIDLDQDMSVF